MQSLSCKVLVIGAGPGGYVAAIRAGQLGLDTIIVENNHSGYQYNAGYQKSLLIESDNFLSTGFIRYSGISTNGYIIKYDLNGDTLWTTELGLLGELDGLFGIESTPDTNYILAGAAGDAEGI